MKKYNKMKIVFCLMIGAIFFGSLDSVYAAESDDIGVEIVTVEKVDYEEVQCKPESNIPTDMGDCSVTIKTDDMDIEVTLHDVSTWECVKLKAKALWAKLTGDL